MTDKIRVAILDDHQAIIDGYIFRLSQTQGIEVVDTAIFGDELERMMANHPVDVLLLDVLVPKSSDNANPFPILHEIPKILQDHPDLKILVISMHDHRTLIKSIMEAGASGYILKDDQATIKELGNVVTTIAKGGIHLSQGAYQKLFRKPSEMAPTARQLEVLSLCATYPNATTTELANHLEITSSTVRNLLSNAYLRLKVRNRAAAVIKARQLGLITPHPPSVEI